MHIYEKLTTNSDISNIVKEYLDGTYKSNYPDFLLKLYKAIYHNSNYTISSDLINTIIMSKRPVKIYGLLFLEAISESLSKGTSLDLSHILTTYDNKSKNTHYLDSEYMVEITNNNNTPLNEFIYLYTINDTETMIKIAICKALLTREQLPCT